MLQELLNLEIRFWIDSGMNTSFEWFSRFKRGVSHDDDGAACSYHSSTRKGDENVNWVKEIFSVKTITVCVKLLIRKNIQYLCC